MNNAMGRRRYELLAFVRDDDRSGGSLVSARHDFAALERSAHGDYAMLNYALETARLRHAAGEPVWDVFAEARQALSALPAGASIKARWIAGMGSTATILVVVVLASIVFAQF